MSTNGNGHGEIGHNSSGLVKDYIDRLERLDGEINGLKENRADLLKEAALATGFAKVSFNNVVKERSKSRGEVHATYTEMAAIRRALGMRDPLLPIEGEDHDAKLRAIARDGDARVEELRSIMNEAGI